MVLVTWYSLGEVSVSQRPLESLETLGLGFGIRGLSRQMSKGAQSHKSGEQPPLASRNNEQRADRDVRRPAFCPKVSQGSLVPEVVKGECKAEELAEVAV